MRLKNKSKGICLIHRYLKLNLASYVQHWNVDFPEFEANKEIPEEEINQDLKTTEWITFPQRYTRFP